MEKLKPLGSVKSIHKVLALLFDIQNQGKAHVFLDIQGHCGWFSIEIYLGGWEYSKDKPDKEYSHCRFGDKEKIKSIEEELKEVLDTALDYNELAEKRKKEQEEKERQQYEKLKAKYENDALPLPR